MLAAINCQKVLVKIDPGLKYGNHYHSLACFYTCAGNIKEANDAFITALTHPNAEITGGLHTEYAQFLILNKDGGNLIVDSSEISKHLYAAINSNNLGGLQHGKIEQTTVCSILQDLIKQKNATVKVDPKVLAYYLLLTHPQYVLENDKVNDLVQGFTKACSNSQEETSYMLFLGLLENSLDNLYKLFNQSPDNNQEVLAFLSNYLNKSLKDQDPSEPELIGSVIDDTVAQPDSWH